jgi:hypothetical protein
MKYSFRTFFRAQHSIAEVVDSFTMDPQEQQQRNQSSSAQPEKE